MAAPDEGRSCVAGAGGLGVVLDSNVIIYAAHPEHGALRHLIAEEKPSISVVSKNETLGYHRLSDAERQFLEEFFAASYVLPVSDAVTEAAIRLRQNREWAASDLAKKSLSLPGLPTSERHSAMVATCGASTGADRSLRQQRGRLGEPALPGNRRTKNEERRTKNEKRKTNNPFHVRSVDVRALGRSAE
jgi:toxin FitB